MNKDKRIEEIRKAERLSHTMAYSEHELFERGTWLANPIHALTDLYPYYKEYEKINVLDLGCGIGRNSIPFAIQFKENACKIDCVDLLELAIEQLHQYSCQYGVEQMITGVVSTAEAYAIKPNFYDLIIAASVLEHMESKEAMEMKLLEIAKGMRKKGICCLLMNTQITEQNLQTKSPLVPQFEINLDTKEMLQILEDVFEDWRILDCHVSPQQYEIPREQGTVNLKTNVVVFVAQKKD
ncbi:methyltransferase [Lachnospiraceae bacterium KM106-2]|nr:methyltransferase [Lachnospiraceae bacterium KM106-2]